MKPLLGKSFMVFQIDNRFRVFLQKVIHKDSWFEIFIFVCILIQAITITFYNPINGDLDLVTERNLQVIQTVTTIFFTLEFLIKAIVHGFYFNGENSYLKSGWNKFDFIFVLLPILDLIEQATKTKKQLQIIKIFRVVRSLRIISRNEGLKNCVEGLILSIPGIIRVFAVCTLYCTMHSMYFVTVLSNKFMHCKIPEEIKYQVD